MYLHIIVSDRSNSGARRCRQRAPEFERSLTMITSEREARSEFLLIYTKNLSMSDRPAGPPAVVTLLRGLYLWNHKPDSQAVFFDG